MNSFTVAVVSIYLKDVYFYWWILLFKFRLIKLNTVYISPSQISLVCIHVYFWRYNILGTTVYLKKARVNFKSCTNSTLLGLINKNLRVLFKIKSSTFWIQLCTISEYELFWLALFLESSESSKYICTSIYKKQYQ